MSTVIQPSEVRKGDKIKVSWTSYGVEYTRTGVVHVVDSVYDCMNEEGVWLALRTHKGQAIELLERPKTVAEILKERRDKLAKDLGGGSRQETYYHCSRLAQAAIDRIIKLEDEKEELTK